MQPKIELPEYKMTNSSLATWFLLLLGCDYLCVQIAGNQWRVQGEGYKAILFKKRYIWGIY